MKIAVSSQDKDINSEVDDIFGRCPYFIIADIEDKKIKESKTIENTNVNQMGGAGIATAQMMAENDVNAVITGNVGPRAFDVLKQFSIDVYSGKGSVKEALQKFIDGKLEKIQ